MMQKNLKSFKGIKAAVLTVSDSVSRGSRNDESGEFLVGSLRRLGALVLKKNVVPDEERLIKKMLRNFCDKSKVDLVLSCGGTGLGPRDVTPESTLDIFHREVCGIAELMRLKGIGKTKRAALSRGRAGIRGRTLIINLPGSLRGAQESFEAVRDILPHALAMIRGEGHI